jgi:glyceraldehyde-3-phosphate dehydrogenase/erythrose-4-phosphate dehydrogenase
VTGQGDPARFFKVVSWYDNEMGYAVRRADMLRFMEEKEPAGLKSRQAVGA